MLGEFASIQGVPATHLTWQLIHYGVFAVILRWVRDKPRWGCKIPGVGLCYSTERLDHTL